MTAAVLMPSRPEGRAEDGFGATGSGEWPPLGSRSVTYAKVVIAGGFGVGKTTFVASASQVRPARTEVVLSATGTDPCALASTPRKVTTTAAMDVGRLSLASDLVLVLFGTCGHARFWSTFLAVCRGAAATVLLVDTRRLADCFVYLDLFDRERMPFLIAVNAFDHSPVPPPAAVREALALDPSVPLVKCDARSPTSTRQVLAIAAEYLLGWQPLPDPPVR